MGTQTFRIRIIYGYEKALWFNVTTIPIVGDFIAPNFLGDGILTDKQVVKRTLKNDSNGHYYELIVQY